MNRPILDWEYNDQYSPRELAEHLGDLPTYIFRDDLRAALDQINERSRTGWETRQNTEAGRWSLMADEMLVYTGLPALAPAARAQHMGDTILAYPLGFVAISHADGTFSVARVA